MARDDIGNVPCAFCKGTAPVRKNAKAKLYYVCNGCGIVQPNMPGFQDWILEHAKITGAAIELKNEKEVTVTLPAVHAEKTKEIDTAKIQTPHFIPPPKQPTPDKPKRGGFGLIKF